MKAIVTRSSGPWIPPRAGHLLIGVVISAAALFGLVQLAAGLWIPAKAALSQTLLLRAWEAAEATGEPVKPWPWADTTPLAKVSVPRLGEETIVLRGVHGEALAFGPGHHPGTVLPGERGTSVLAAHRDTHFSYLERVRAGDRIVVERGGETVAFKVKGARIARWDRSGLDAGPAETARLALVTCYPFGAREPGPLRYIVEAERVGNGGGAQLVSR